MSGLKQEDFEDQGQWMDGDRKISNMWMHKPTGEIYYEDNDEVKARELPIYPWWNLKR